MNTLDNCVARWARIDRDRVFLEAPIRLTYGMAEEEIKRRSLRLSRLAGDAPALLSGPNSAEWVLNLLALFRANIPVALLPRGLAQAERRSLELLSNAAVTLVGDEWSKSYLSDHVLSLEWRRSGAALAFASSGSTGQPKVVLRSHASLIDEGERYCRLWNNSADDVIVASMPLSHAYSFGAALAAAVVGGSGLSVAEFHSARTLAGQVQKSKATILPLIGSVARALALVDDGTPVSSNLRVAMVGAGRVTPEMSDLFERKWGLGLAQNYGSSETGALLACGPPYATRCTGFPLAGIECELVGSEAGSGPLWVRMHSPPLGYLTVGGWEPARLSPGSWWPMNDMFAKEGSGCFAMLGRIDLSIRRGGHTIYPAEIEAALGEHPAVDDVVVRRVDDGLDDAIEADVQLKPGTRLGSAEFRDYLLPKLSAHKLPTRWNISEDLPKTWSFKIDPRRLDENLKLQQASSADLLPLLTSYRFSEALLAAEDIGLLTALSAGPSDPSALALRLGLDAEALALFLRLLESVGVVSETASGYRLIVGYGPQWKPAFSFEAQLRRSWLTAKTIAEVLRAGLAERPFNRQSPDVAFTEAYRMLMCGPARHGLAQHLARTVLLPPGARVLEIGRGLGTLVRALRSRTPDVRFDLRPLAPAPPLIADDIANREGIRILPVACWAEITPEADPYHLIVLSNCIHWLRPDVAKDALARIASALAPSGKLAISDMFLSDGSSDAGGCYAPWLFLLDWMTHGGTYTLTISELVEHLRRERFRDIEAKPAPNFSAYWIYGARPAPLVPGTLTMENHYD